MPSWRSRPVTTTATDWPAPAAPGDTSDGTGAGVTVKQAQVPVPPSLRGKAMSFELRAIYNLKDQVSG